MAASSSSTATKPSIGILSIGDMGMGVAKLLKAHDYAVYTVASGRSQHTKDRIKAAQIKNLDSDEALVIECDIILSIVPPRDSLNTGRRIYTACKNAARERQERKGFANLLFMDLNAISSRTAKKISRVLKAERASLSLSSSPPTAAAAATTAITATATEPVPPPPTKPPSLTTRLSRTLSIRGTDSLPPPPPVVIHFLDGGIIGPPPQLNASDKTWKKPSIVVSGEADSNLTSDLKTVLRIKIISEEIGTASTLKSCFASLSKGLLALTVASYTTAHTAGVLPELQSHLAEYFPALKEHVEKSLPSVAPKAYRWVDEMKHIGETLADEGHFGSTHGGQIMFDGVSEVYRTMADETVLGKEVIGKRKRGTTVEDVAEAMRAGLEEKRQKAAQDPKLELVWRSSWGV